MTEEPRSIDDPTSRPQHPAVPPPEGAPGSVARVIGVTDQAPGAGHHVPESGFHGGIASILAATQFVFTGVFILVVAGLMYTAGLHAGKGGEEGKKPTAPQGEAVDVATLLHPTPELIATGKNVFAINCASCHGTSGKGDGPAAAALNPKPRDYTSGFWRYGGGVARIVQTITNGSPGTAMAPFPGIPLHDRFALAHYIRTFAPKQEADKPEDLAWLDQFGGGGKRDTTGAAPATGTAAAPQATIPIERAMALLAEPSPPPGTVTASAPDSTEGGILYARRCASCHGVAGEGGVRTRMLGSAPYAYVTTRSFGRPGTLARDAGSFENIVLHGLTGGMMPGNGDLTKEQIRAIYAYTQSLRARQEGAARTRS